MQKNSSVDFLPVGLRIRGKRILIVGGGKVGFHKASLLRRFTSEVTIVSSAFQAGFDGLPFELRRKKYDPSDLEDMGLVYICTENHELNRRIKADAGESASGQCLRCTVVMRHYLPCCRRIGNLSISVSSDGKDVKRSIRIRNRINELIEKGLLNID